MYLPTVDLGSTGAGTVVAGADCGEVVGILWVFQGREWAGQRRGSNGERWILVREDPIPTFRHSKTPPASPWKIAGVGPRY